MSDPAKYRTRDEVQAVREKRDPIEHLGQKLVAEKLASEDDLKSVDKDIRKIVADAAALAEESPEPDEQELYTNVLVETY